MRKLQLGVSPRDGLLALAVGGLSAAAFPPVGGWPLAVVAVALGLWLLRDRDPTTARNLGLLYGLAYGLGVMHWFFGIFSFVAVSLIAIFAAYFGLLATLIATTRGRSPFLRAALTALFAVGIDWLRGDAWYLRFPWYTLPHALATEPLAVAPVYWLGTYGFTFALWLVAAWGAFGRPWVWGLFLVVPACALLRAPVEPAARRALIVQAEETPAESLFTRVPEEKVDLIVLPEYAYFMSPERALAQRRSPGELARRLGAPVVFGAVVGEYGEPDFQNVAAVVDAYGTLLGTFVKQRPIPLFRDGVAGTERPVFPLEQGTLGVLICYDADAPAVAAALVRGGAAVLVVPTFDARSWGRLQHVHHELLMRLRAVENDRWLVRATSSGRSETIDPHGRPSAERLDFGVTGGLTVGYGHRHRPAPGSYLAFLGPAGAALTALLGAVRLLAPWLVRPGVPKNDTNPNRPQPGE